MLIEKPLCNFKNCRYFFDGNCRSADKYENCTLTDLHCEIAKLTVDLDNAKTEVAREIFEDLLKEASLRFDGFRNTIIFPLDYYNELKKKYTEGNNGDGK